MVSYSVMVVAVLILLGLCFGSFINALVWRLHQQSQPKETRKAGKKDLSILKGRSMCVHCNHTLYLKDLVPVLSWLSSYGRCRYCRRRIHWQYPVLEITMPVLFVFSYYFWPEPFDASGVLGFGVWLAALVGLIALLVYDIRWMLLPNKIIGPLAALVGLAVIIDAAFLARSEEVFISALAGALVGGGIFYVLFQVSKGKWIGGGDVKLGFLLGLLVGSPVLALLVLFLASLIGTIVSVPLMASKKIAPHARIPFGPFLIIAAVVVQLFGDRIIDWYLQMVGL